MSIRNEENEFQESTDVENSDQKETCPHLEPMITLFVLAKIAREIIQDHQARKRLHFSLLQGS